MREYTRRALTAYLYRREQNIFPVTVLAERSNRIWSSYFSVPEVTSKIYTVDWTRDKRTTERKVDRVIGCYPFLDFLPN
jgi:hypothetical protein